MHWKKFFALLDYWKLILFKKYIKQLVTPFLLEISIIFLLIFVQSYFGVGLLVFGTPTFLILDYSFSQTLSILLPISCFISFLQVISSQKESDKKFFFNFTKFSIPGVLIFLPISVFYYEQIKIEFLIGIVMMLIPALNLFKKFELKIIFFAKKYYKFFLLLIGVIHGSTNLGGGLITIFSSINYSQNKHSIRRVIAISYLYFGLIQLSLILLLNKFYFSIEYLSCCFLVPIIFFFSNKYFQKTKIENYKRNLNFLIMIYGAIIINNFFS